MLRSTDTRQERSVREATQRGSGLRLSNLAGSPTPSKTLSTSSCIDKQRASRQASLIEPDRAGSTYGQPQQIAGQVTSNYISSILARSSLLLNSLKKQYYSNNNNNNNNHHNETMADMQRSSADARPAEGQPQSINEVMGGQRVPKRQPPQPMGAESTSASGSQRTSVDSCEAASQFLERRLSSGCPDFASSSSSCTGSTGSGASARAGTCPGQQLAAQHVPPPLPPPPNPSSVTSVAPARRHAIQEQSLERDAAVSLRIRDMKHKRTSSIKSALRHAHLPAPLRSATVKGTSGTKKKLAGLNCAASSTCGAGGASDSSAAHTMPYELFEPVVTQRTVQRSRRRGAMMVGDSRRQMSADTIGLRQLTDEYLHNAGVKPISSSGQSSLVALTASTRSAATGSVALHRNGTSTLEHCSSIEAQLYQASRVAGSSISYAQPGSSTGNQACCAGASSSADSAGSEDSAGGSVTVFPASLPWQSDVSVQCELIRAPPTSEPYETTGDLLNTLAGPFRARASTMNLAAGANQAGAQVNSAHLQLSATLKRGLTAISQHHLSPVSQNVVGSLKKSLSNTLDISLAGASQHLHSQDSLPAYSSLTNEPDSPDTASQLDVGSKGSKSPSQLASNGATLAPEACDGPTEASSSATGASAGDSGLMSQLASKLGRQASSKKFSVSKKGLQRAFSFDSRGYKRLEQSDQPKQQKTGGQQYLAIGCGFELAARRAHNKSSLAISSSSDSAQQAANQAGPRPYLAQSASQVDFQIPLLPYHKMQEAIVSQRLLEPPKQQSSEPSQASSQVELRQPDADELLCSAGSTGPPCDIKPIKAQQDSTQQHHQASERRQAKLVLDIPISSNGLTTTTTLTAATPPAISTPHAIDSLLQQQHPQLVDSNSANKTRSRSSLSRTAARGSKPDGAELSAEQGAEDAWPTGGQDETQTLGVQGTLCLPSPGLVPIETGDSSSFYLDPLKPQGVKLGGDQLTATDVFARSKSLIKRPSTMMMSNSDAMNQVAQALQSAGQTDSALRNRRQAIVPPKLVTDASNSDGESGAAAVGHLIDVDENSNEQVPFDDEAATVRALRRKRSGGATNSTVASSPPAQFALHQQVESSKQDRDRRNLYQRCNDDGTVRRLSGSATSQLPTFCIEPDHSQLDSAGTGDLESASTTKRRPDSQATNVDSIVSSGSSNNLSCVKDDFTVTSPGGLTVSFGSLRSRRRSSIAVIPQMQICPGDLLVYSKQLIDRMNQSDDQTNEPPQFLTIDDKKGKNIWSSLKLFDNRTMKARNELLCSLEDVLASLQPSTFVDEQLWHYKGMLWDEFIYETESRRSASSEALTAADAATTNVRCGAIGSRTGSYPTDYEPTATPLAADAAMATTSSLERDMTCTTPASSIAKPRSSSSVREPIKVTLSSGPLGQVSSQTGTHQVAPARPGSSPPVTPHRSREQSIAVGSIRPLSSRFREKPKLKRGQTVDSVFRIPLIPSSPLKHAQQHQQTPTAHLEDHELNEDDERISTPSTGEPADPLPVGPLLARAARSSSSTKSRGPDGGSNQNLDMIGGSGRQQLGGSLAATARMAATSGQTSGAQSGDQDSSFETDDALDLIMGDAVKQGGASGGAGFGSAHTPFQMVRQSSLSTLSSTITRTEQKRQRALWDLFQSECAFFFDHLMTLKNVYMEPLKKIQVEGFAMFADPDVLFGNLDELCCGVYDFCKEFLYIIMRTLKTRPEELNATDVLIKLYKKNPKIDHLRGVYHRYTLNYINALTYLESLRRQVEFVEFEKWSSRDIRCKKLQLTDLLVAPVQHIMRVPIILRDIESHTENMRDRDEIRAILAVEEASLRELDDKMRWLKNFERLLEIQKNIQWPNVLELDSKLFIPDFLKDVLSKQPCEKLIVSPRRQIVHEGTLTSLDTGKACDMHVILFDDMLLLTRRKKGLTKKASTVCKTNSGGSSTRDDGSFKYIVYKQPLSLDRFYVHDVQQVDAQAVGMKNLFLLIVLNRFQQITNVHSFSAPNDDIKQTWLFKIKKTAERWKRNQLSGSVENQQQQQLASSVHPHKVAVDDQVDLAQQTRQITVDQPARKVIGAHHVKGLPDVVGKTGCNQTFELVVTSPVVSHDMPACSAGANETLVSSVH